MSYQDEIISMRAKGLTFADIGGLWGAANEKVSVAIRAGASRAAMIDIVPLDHSMWSDFREACSKLGVSGYEEFSGNIDDDTLSEKCGTFDFIHCSGVIYHVPNPVATLERLRHLTNRFLLLGSMTVPKIVKGKREGSIDFSKGRCIFIPAIDEIDRSIMAEHFSQLGLKIHNLAKKDEYPWRYGMAPNYAPWWWFWTAETLADIVSVCGFKVLEINEHWKDRAHYVFCEKVV